ncbi:MAG: PilZ domain-containing protein [Candidatus Electrothrix sp. GM3_4]|nr:PilZ domain-containing protein [Candidatus Electrothrix sp. GM3_4]
MDNKKINQDRINELKNKISYAENARDNYKEKHAILYETNSFYLDRLRKELGDLEMSSIDMNGRNQRKFPRIKIQRDVRIDFSSARCHGFVDNISLSGSFVEGVFKQLKGDICRIDLKESALYSGPAARAIGSIVRVDDNGIAIQFIAMKLKTYLLLKTELLTKSGDPSVLGDEIVQRSIFEFHDDLVCSSIFLCKKDKLNKLLDFP